jgi:hypothetical protein
VLAKHSTRAGRAPCTQWRRPLRLRGGQGDHVVASFAQEQADALEDVTEKLMQPPPLASR